MPTFTHATSSLSIIELDRLILRRCCRLPVRSDEVLNRYQEIYAKFTESSWKPDYRVSPDYHTRPYSHQLLQSRSSRYVLMDSSLLTPPSSFSLPAGALWSLSLLELRLLLSCRCNLQVLSDELFKGYHERISPWS